MPDVKDIQFGKLALAHKICTPAQIEECLLEQAKLKEPLTLKEILRNKGYITFEQQVFLMGLQTPAPAPSTPRKETQASLFGRIAVQAGFVTQQQVDECIKIRETSPEKPLLGEIMISKGYLKPEQVNEILSRQQKKIMHCKACKISYTILTVSGTKKVDCPRCKQELAEGRLSTPPRTHGELATDTIPVVKKDELEPEQDIPDTEIEEHTCVICDSRFEGAVDENGRLRCPNCKTTFTAR